MKWYVIQSRANQQQRAETNFCNQGFAIFSPSIPVERITRRKRVIREEVVSSHYIFMRLGLAQSDWCVLNNTRGVGKIVSFNSSPCSVSGYLISALCLQFGTQEIPVVLFKTGEKVQVTDGCFKYIEAIVKSVTADERESPYCCTLCTDPNGYHAYYPIN